VAPFESKNAIGIGFANPPQIRLQNRSKKRKIENRHGPDL